MRILVAILVISILGNLFGLYVAYKFWQKRQQVAELDRQLQAKDAVLVDAASRLPRQMVFIHHSVGRNWLKDGGLRDSLMQIGLGIKSITRGCPLGEETDMNHWVPKFTSSFDEIAKFGLTDSAGGSSEMENSIIMFKSCYPNSDIVSEGAQVGNPYDSTKTISNYKAVFDTLMKAFSAYPEKNFIYVTSPPLVPSKTNPENASRAREFTEWVKSDFIQRYEQETGLTNFHVFDLFDLLADQNNVLRAEYRRAEHDSHPNREGSLAATRRFMGFLKTEGLAGSGEQVITASR